SQTLLMLWPVRAAFQNSVQSRSLRAANRRQRLWYLATRCAWRRLCQMGGLCSVRSNNRSLLPAVDEIRIWPRSWMMRRILLATVLASLAAGPGLTTVAHAQAPAAEPAQYSVAETPAGKMIDDPRAAAILQELIP